MAQELLSRKGTISEVIIDTASSGDNTLVAAVAGQTIRMYKIILYANVNNNVTLKDGSSTKLMGVINLLANTGFVIDPDTQGHCPFTLTTGNALVLNLSAAAQVSGRVWYAQE